MQLKIEMNLQMEASLQYNSSYNEGFGGTQQKKLKNIDSMIGTKGNLGLFILSVSILILVAIHAAYNRIQLESELNLQAISGLPLTPLP